MSRSSTLPQKLKDMADLAGGIQQLCKLMNVPYQTLWRWGKIIREQRHIPRSALRALGSAEHKLYRGVIE